jgi:acetylornithine deacetylase/succinyl-diaminopimelate desuccinylase-like protein
MTRTHIVRKTASACALGLSIMLGCIAPARAYSAPDWNKLSADALDYFRTYLKFDTTNPPSNTSVSIAWMKSILDKAGIATETFESKPGIVSLIARLPGPAGVKPMLLMSHADVVPAIASNWTHPPFSADLDGGFVWARGAIDNKAHGIMALVTILELKRRNLPLRRGVEMMVNPDEEAGGANGAEWMVKNHWDAIDPAFAFNEGGAGQSGWLGTHGLSFLVSVTEKRVMWLRLTVKGHAGHGSIPRPDNPNLTMIKALARLLENQPDYRITPVISDAMAAASASQSFPESFELAHLTWPAMVNMASRGVLAPYNLQALMRDTISLTMLNAGYKVNVVPSTSEAALDCRLLPGTDADAFMRYLKSLLGDSVAIEYIQKPDEAPPSPSSGEAWDAMSKVVARDFKDAALVPWMTAGGTDSRFIRAKGVPAYGFVPIVLDSGEFARVHGDNERLSVKNLDAGLRATYDLTVALCASGN